LTIGFHFDNNKELSIRQQSAWHSIRRLVSHSVDGIYRLRLFLSERGGSFTKRGVRHQLLSRLVMLKRIPAVTVKYRCAEYIGNSIRFASLLGEEWSLMTRLSKNEEPIDSDDGLWE
jgi:hypothetical protein